MAKKKAVKKAPRSRNQSGVMRDKRDDTFMGTVEKKYNRDFGVRSDMHLGNFLKRHKIKSLNDLVQSNKGKK